MRQNNLPERRPQAKRSRIISLLLALSGWIVFGIVAARAPTPARVIVVFAFTLICPGAALVRLLPLRDLLERAVLSVAIGLSLAALAAETAATGHPPQALVVVAALALVCTLAAAVAEATLGEEAR
jgi:uncharacterized membrane protein